MPKRKTKKKMVMGVLVEKLMSMPMKKEKEIKVY